MAKKILSILVCVIAVTTTVITRVTPVLAKMDPVQKAAALRQETYSLCKTRVNVPDEDMNWLYVPQQPSELNSNVPYFFLAGQLIQSGAVDASSCPAGGLATDGFANACGLAVTLPEVTLLQNTFNEAILAAWETTGVPPVMLKQLIQTESQFWPTQWKEVHFGLGHLTYAGAVTGLTWYLPLRNEVCSESGGCTAVDNFSLPYQLLTLMDASCPNCAIKIDVEKARRSINLLAGVLMGFCYQTAQIIFNATEMPSYYVVDYATIWKLTLLSYNTGPSCTFQMVQDAYNFHERVLDWTDIRLFADDDLCQRGVAYVDQIIAPFYDFPAIGP